MGGEIVSLRDLYVWRKAIAFAKEVYRVSDLLPRSELYGLRSRLRRAAVSVSSNIVEGHARQVRGFVRFLSIARGSVAEVESQLLFAVELGYLTMDETCMTALRADEIGHMITVLLRKLRPNP